MRKNATQRWKRVRGRVQGEPKGSFGTALTFRARARFRLLPTDAPRVGISSSMLEAKSLG